LLVLMSLYRHGRVAACHYGSIVGIGANTI
jgi:hypothetical protein